MTRVVTLLFVAACGIVPPAARGATLTVDCSGAGDYLTIQEAVSAAGNGDTIAVAPCTYVEAITLPTGRGLTIAGEDASSVILAWSGPEPVITLNNVWTTIRGLSVRPTGGGDAIRNQWPTMAGLRLYDSDIEGWIGLYGPMTAEGSSIDSFGAGARDQGADFTSCRVGYARVCGMQFYGSYGISSRESTFGEIVLDWCAGVWSVADSIGRLELSGGLDAWSEARVRETRLGTLYAREGPWVVLEECDVDSIDYGLFSGGMSWPLSVSGCLVRGDVKVRPGQWASGQRVAGANRSTGRQDCELLHTTVLGNLDLGSSGSFLVASSIVMGGVSLSSPWGSTITHNDLVGPVAISSPGYDPTVNLAADPLFCAPTNGDYTLQECSPCVGAALDGGDIGAFGVGCGCWTSAKPASWGGIKALFRQTPN